MAGDILNYLLVITFAVCIAMVTADTTTDAQTSTSGSTAPTSGSTAPTSASTAQTTAAAGETTTAVTTEDLITTMRTTTSATPNIPTFYAPGKDGNVCMIIAMQAVIAVQPPEKEEVRTEVPIDADVSRYTDECPDTPTTSFMELGWVDQDKDFTLYLQFEVMEDKYTMVLINGSMTVEEEGEPVEYYWEQSEDLKIPNVPLGNSVHCKDVTLDNIDFREYQFQPFAQKTSGEFGEVMECETDDGLDTIWIIVISVVAGLTFIGLIGGGVYCMRKRKSSTYESV